MTLLLIRYNELGLKSPRVRSRFQKQMIKNIEDKFLRVRLDCFIESAWGRIYLNTDDQSQGINLLSTVFGITSVSPVITTKDDIENIVRTTVDYAKKLLKNDQSFALRTRRTGKHSYTSMELAQVVGKAILDQLKNKKLKVNLSTPDKEIHIEVRNKQSFIFSEFFSGPGGLPMGTQGKVICVFSNGQSYIAAWLMMKRGCRVYPVLFETQGKNSATLETMANEQIKILKPWAANINLKVIKAVGSAENISAASFIENNEFVDFTHKISAKGICFSYNLEGFAALSSEIKTDLPIFYPLIGLDNNMIRDLGNRIKRDK